jgi:hypothetical protein
LKVRRLIQHLDRNLLIVNGYADASGKGDF